MRESEVQTLIACADDRERKLAIRTLWRASARSVTVAERLYPSSLIRGDGDADIPAIRVEVKDSRSERDKPTKMTTRVIPEKLYRDLEQWCEDTNRSPDTPIFSVQSAQMQNWVTEAAAVAADETGIEMWERVTSHDLRRSGITQMKMKGLSPLLIQDHGDWSDLENMKPYLDVVPLEKMHREMERAGWLPGEEQSARDRLTRIENDVDAVKEMVEQLVESGSVEMDTEDDDSPAVQTKPNQKTLVEMAADE
ncbi:site-specific integrase [Halobaculum sp. MBLA0147]|uniref:site-specific integrase n=1 Tax=Halobaculum sp. MBLA0147 TaxID=3079934 RepID=UPI00352580C0